MEKLYVNLENFMKINTTVMKSTPLHQLICINSLTKNYNCYQLHWVSKSFCICLHSAQSSCDCFIVELRSIKSQYCNTYKYIMCTSASLIAEYCSSNVVELFISKCVALIFVSYIKTSTYHLGKGFGQQWSLIVWWLTLMMWYKNFAALKLDQVHCLENSFLQSLYKSI